DSLESPSLRVNLRPSGLWGVPQGLRSLGIRRGIARRWRGRGRADPCLKVKSKDPRRIEARVPGAVAAYNDDGASGRRSRMRHSGAAQPPPLGGGLVCTFVEIPLREP